MKRFSLLATLPLLMLILNACATPAQQAPASEQLAELTAEYDRLEQRYNQLRAQVEKLDEAVRTTGFLEPQVLIEPATFTQSGETLQQVLNRGTLRCGANINAPGVGFLDTETGETSGFDTDLCRAIAAAVFGQNGSENISLVATTNRSRFPALQSGDVDVLIRNTTWTLTHDSTLGINFAGPTFYDGVSLLVRKESGITTLLEAAEQSICALTGGTAEAAVVEYYEFFGETIVLEPYQDVDSARASYERGDCASLAGEKIGLLGQRLLMAEPQEHVVLEEFMTSQPFAPAVRHGDDNWLDVVNWVVQCTLNAEYLGVGQRNVARQLGSDDPRIQRLLGEVGELGEGLGLENDFCYQAVAQVGNYGDIYSRNLGPNTPFNLPRGLNALFNNGGLHHPLPFQ